MINILDIVVIAIILLFLFRGFAKGLVYSIFDLASYFIAAFAAAKYNKAVTEILKKTVLYEKVEEAINNAIINNVDIPNEVTNMDLLDVNNNAVKDSIDSLAIPVHAKQIISDSLDTSNLLSHTETMSNLSSIISGIIFTMLSIVLIFILVKAVLSIIAFFIHQFMSLPILSTVNRLFGGVFGIVNGLFIIYIVCGVLSIFNITNTFNSLPDLINNSIIAKNFFYNNILLEYLLKF